jgi:hypothetical protein
MKKKTHTVTTFEQPGRTRDAQSAMKKPAKDAPKRPANWPSLRQRRADEFDFDV